MAGLTVSTDTPVEPRSPGLGRGVLRRALAVPAARVGVLLVLVPLFAIIVVPVLVVAVGSLWSATFIRLPGNFTLSHYVRVLGGSQSLGVMWTTAQMTLGASALALAIGGFQAWIVGRTNVPFRPVVRWLPVAPLLVSALVANTGFVALYSPSIGVVNTVLMNAFGLEGPIFNIFSMPGLILALGTQLAPIPYLILLGPLTSMSQSLDEASRASGAKRWRTFWYVSLPLLRPALLSSFTLTAVLASHAFETPLLIGMPGGISTYVSAIYISIAAQVNYSLASAQAMVYLALIGALLWWNRRLTRVEARFALIAGKGHAPGVMKLGASRYALLGVVGFFFVFSALSPVAVNFFLALLPFYSTTSELPPFSFENFRVVLAMPQTLEAIRNSFLLATAVSVTAVLLATLLAVIAFKTKMRGRRLAEEIGTLPLAFPPLIFSIALLITVLSIPGASALYNTIYLLFMVLVVVFLPFGLRVVGSVVLALDSSLLEASASSGARMGRTLRSVVLPLIVTAILGAIALVFIFSFRELGAIALVTPPGVRLLPVHIYGLYATGILRNVYALNVVSFILTVAAFLVLAVCVRFASRRVARTRALAQLDQFKQLDQITEPEEMDAARSVMEGSAER